MPDMDVLGWIVVGLVAGALSGWAVGDRTARGCLPNLVVGIAGGAIGGWIFQAAGGGQTSGFIGAVVVAFLGAALLRLVLRAIEGRR
jgi:uncharacterized membrane protein YeaQ/YmgE (transglycosylase-associated protein family)